MFCFLSCNTNNIEITREPTALSTFQSTLSANFDNRTIKLETHSDNLIYNGYALISNATYTLQEEDILEIDKMAYSVKFSSNPAKKFKADSSRKITSFFNSTSDPQPDESTLKEITGTWSVCPDHIVFTPNLNKSSAKVAAFDLDGTLIKTSSGKKYAENKSDWMLLYKSVPKVLKEYYDKNYKLVIFSNQMPIGTDKAKRLDMQEKVQAVLNTIKLPMQVFMATGRNQMRKPCVGMWKALCEQNEDTIDMQASFYVGDAAGRPKTTTTSKDHSYADLLFAKNVGVPFRTPEEFFLGAKPVKVEIPFDPKLTNPRNEFKLSDTPEVIVMVGAPASGKSTFCKMHLIPAGYVHVSRDIVGSQQRCAKLVTEALKANKCVVVDNTNKDKASRMNYIKLAKDVGVPCRCFYVNVEKVRAMHNNRYRELINAKHDFIRDVIIHSHYKGFEQPQLAEGFNEIVELKSSGDFSDSESLNQDLYNMYLLEKYY